MSERASFELEFVSGMRPLLRTMCVECRKQHLVSAVPLLETGREMRCTCGADITPMGDERELLLQQLKRVERNGEASLL